MKSSRAAIYQAVFAKAKTVAGIKTFSRIWSPADQLDFGVFPALFQEDLDEQKEYTEYKGLLPRYELRCDLTIYLAITQSRVPVGQETLIPSDILSGILDSLEAAFAAPLNQKQTLGGLVEHAQIDGRIQRVAGIPNKNFQVSMAVVPVIITTY